MPFKRSVSMPEVNDFLVSSYSTRTNDLEPLHEHEVYSGDPQEITTTTESEKDKSQKSSYGFPDGDYDEAEDTIGDDDYGFFPMDDDDDFQVGETQDQYKILEEDADSVSNSDSSSEQLSSSYNSSTMRQSNRKKSALKRGSAYGDSKEGIPLDFERKEFNRVLPKPDLSHRASNTSSLSPKSTIRRRGSGLFRVSSEPVFVRPVYQSDDRIDDLPIELEDPKNSVSSSGFVEGAMKKRISFGTIQIREHTQTIGDNPACSYGTPVQLDWEHQDLEELKVDEYETFRPKTRTKEEFHLNHFQRRNLLKLNGYSLNEIKDSKRKVSKSRNQRERTKFLVMNYPNLVSVEDAIESGLRKVKRSISKSKLSTQNDIETISRESSKDDLTLYTSGLSKQLVLDMMSSDVSNATAPF